MILNTSMTSDLKFDLDISFLTMEIHILHMWFLELSNYYFFCKEQTFHMQSKFAYEVFRWPVSLSQFLYNNITNLPQESLQSVQQHNIF